MKELENKLLEKINNYIKTSNGDLKVIDKLLDTPELDIEDAVDIYFEEDNELDQDEHGCDLDWLKEEILEDILVELDLYKVLNKLHFLAKSCYR